MDTKQYLMQISKLDRMINNKLSEIIQYRQMIYGLQAITNEERVQTTPNFDKIGTSISKLDEMKRNVNGLVDELVNKKHLIIEQIENMDNELHYQILFSRYIEKKTFEKIATEIDYSFRQTTRLHGQALREFEKKYGNSYKMS